MSNIPEPSTALQKATLFMVLLNGFTTPLMLSAANVALPAIANDLGLHAVMLSWVPMAFLMASAMFVLIFGRLADMYGRKRIFMLGTLSVIITSILAAFSVNGQMLIAMRFLQGVSAAMLYATQLAIVSSVFPPAQRGHAIGMTVSAIYLGLTCGPVIGGYLIDMYNWRAGFVFHIPLALVVLFTGLLKVRGEWRAEEKGKFDAKGAMIYSCAIILFCVGVTQLPDVVSVVFLGLGVVAVWSFLVYAKQAEYPIFDVRLFFANRVFTFSCLASLILYTATFANVVLISLYLQYLKGMSAGAAGFFMMIQPLTMAVFSPFAGRLSDRLEPRLIASAGMLFTGAGLIMLALLNGQSDGRYLVSALVITGLGFSLFSSPNTNAIMSTVEKRHYGSAAGSIATMRVLGQLCSMVLVTSVIAWIVGEVQIRPENFTDLQRAIHTCFVMAAVLCIPGTVFSLVRGRVHNPG